MSDARRLVAPELQVQVLTRLNSAAIDVELLGINVRTDSRFACPEGRCAYEYGTLDIAGLGSATLSGTFAFDGSNEISLQLVGTDTLVIGTDGQCLTTTVGSKTTTHCQEQSAEGGSVATMPGLLQRARELSRR